MFTNLGSFNADLVQYSSFVLNFFVLPPPPPCLCFFCNAFLVPKFCHCKELSTMPIIIMIIIINYELLYLQSLYEQSILSMFHRPSFRAVAVFTLYQLLFKISKGKKKITIARFLQKCLFLYENKRFCSTLYHGSPPPVDQTCSGYKKNQQLRRRRTNAGLKNSAVLGESFLTSNLLTHLFICPSASWGQLHARAGGEHVA